MVVNSSPFLEPENVLWSSIELRGRAKARKLPDSKAEKESILK
jgi:hypothetical protein